MANYVEILAECLDNEEELRPYIRKALEKLKSYGPELKEITDGFLDYIIGRKVADIKYLESAGFSKDEAITIVTDEWYNITKNLRRKK